MDRGEPAQAATIKRIFERYAAGHSMKRIAIDMNNEGILSPQPQKGRVSPRIPEGWALAT